MKIPLNQLFDVWLEQKGKDSPLTATRWGDHRFDDKLDVISKDQNTDDLKKIEAQLRLLSQVDSSDYSADQKIDLEIWKSYLQYGQWSARNENPWATDPRVYVEMATECTYALLTQSTEPMHRNLQNCASRMKQIPKLLAAAEANIKNPSKILTEIALKRIKGAISFYSTDIFLLAGQVNNELKPASGPVVEALKKYATFLEEQLPEAKDTWRLGKEKFAQKLLLELDAGLTSKDVIEEAEKEATRVESEMYSIAKQLWAKHNTGALPADSEQGRRQVIREVMAKLAQEHGTQEKLLGQAKEDVKRIKKFISDKNILKLPDPDSCDIIEMPEFQRGYSVAYLNPAPPLDVKSKSFYAISPPPTSWTEKQKTSFLEEYNNHMMQILTIHEAYPGHYVQLDYSNRNPSKIRKVLSSGTFAEGWAVYTEQMMLDQGYGDGDLALRLHQLKFYLRAVINSILDYRMHCTEMTDKEAMELLVGRAFQSEGEALGKIDRAKQSSCQLSTYFVGRTAFYRLRQDVQGARGKAFDLAEYHHQVLSHGTLPVKYLPQLFGVKKSVK